MSDNRTRRQIAVQAARMMYAREEKEYFTAKRKAAAQLGVAYRHRPGDLPSNTEIRDQIEIMARMHEGSSRTANLQAMRLDALRLMRKLRRFRPRLIGSVLTGHIRCGSDIDLHVFCDHVVMVTAALEDEGLVPRVENKRIVKHGEERLFTHIHVGDRFNYELTLYPEDKVHYVFRSSITGGPIERADITELERLLHAECPGIDLDLELERLDEYVDRFELYALLLRPLEHVKQDPKFHPEGDALYHSLQCFDLARQAFPYDEEFLLAALLHDVGKAIDPRDHVDAGLQALEGAMTQRTQFLIRHHMDALAIKDRTLGHRAQLRLMQSEYFEDLMHLRDLDSAARRPGVEAPSIEEAIAYLRELESMCDAG